MTRRDITLTIPVYLPDLPRDLRTIRRTVARARTTLAIWRKRAAERRELADMPDHLRRDMGLSLDDLKREATKPFWRG
jgi:uncharacterized protein YjiS (DUF1127 family)